MNDRELSYEEAQVAVRELFGSLDAMKVDDLSVLVQNLYDQAAREEWSTEQWEMLDVLLGPSRQRLFAERKIIYAEDVAEALEELAEAGRLLKVGIGEDGEQHYRVMPLQ